MDATRPVPRRGARRRERCSRPGPRFPHRRAPRRRGADRPPAGGRPARVAGRPARVRPAHAEARDHADPAPRSHAADDRPTGRLRGPAQCHLRGHDRRQAQGDGRDRTRVHDDGDRALPVRPEQRARQDHRRRRGAPCRAERGDAGLHRRIARRAVQLRRADPRRAPARAALEDAVGVGARDRALAGAEPRPLTRLLRSRHRLQLQRVECQRVRRLLRHHGVGRRPLRRIPAARARPAGAARRGRGSSGCRRDRRAARQGRPDRAAHPWRQPRLVRRVAVGVPPGRLHGERRRLRPLRRHAGAARRGRDRLPGTAPLHDRRHRLLPESLPVRARRRRAVR